jgi:2-dehydro-3-deoxy-D-arabinonate dehydratase
LFNKNKIQIEGNMIIHKRLYQGSPRWEVDGMFLPAEFRLSLLLELSGTSIRHILQSLVTEEKAEGNLLPPIESTQEVWASGVTYLRSREARQSESTVGDIYMRVYDAERPELFLKAVGWRVAGHQMPVRIRKDSQWNVPEPELVLVVNRFGEIIGYCAGNDLSSRDIEGQNPLYLPQAKFYNGSCAIGPGIVLLEGNGPGEIKISLDIFRQGQALFHGETSTLQMKRTLVELVNYLTLELDFPQGVFLMTGTGVVPPDGFSLEAGDLVRIKVHTLELENQVES